MDQAIVRTRFPTNWVVNLLCNCRKTNHELKVYCGTAREISLSSLKVSSNHNVCTKREIALQLIIPPLWHGDSEKEVKIVGKTLLTALHDGDFLTEIEFLSFVGDGKEVLARDLQHRFN